MKACGRRPKRRRATELNRAKSVKLLRSQSIGRCTIRKSCYSCGRKHLAQACVLACENEKGYHPTWGWLAVGHLAEAEDELIAEEPQIANEIRDHRVQYMLWLDGDGKRYHLPFEKLIEKVTAAYEAAMSAVSPPDKSPDEEIPLG